MEKMGLPTQDIGDPMKHWASEASSRPLTPNPCHHETVSQEELQPLIDNRPRRWVALFPVVIWVQWAVIACLSIGTLIFWAERRGLLAANREPATAGLPPIEPMVPDGVTEAEEALNYGYYMAEPIPYDIFHNVSVLDQRLSELQYANVASGVKANGRYGVYIDEAGQRRFLYPKLTGKDTEAYLVSGLHHMHCMMETLRDYGLLLDGFRPLWNDHHVVHCFNKWYRSIECAADSTGEGYQEPFGSVPMSEVNRASWGQHRAAVP
ncbi:hypothetical protein LY78DRAFT_663073 [Colletotrichum sublineola]|uniref:Uncharacterized protein n=1 Tax=Colletotrichum sublineola TaxID=1173701 RepID=A0A066XZ66_COLSU|nr:hypothetical protein LY78DRAFT_663073 [Colletotrichum sublineola]KDN71076.1 hypothetical protein CSUB01_10364 [Colletotrichum sublineola]